MSSHRRFPKTLCLIRILVLQFTHILSSVTLIVAKTEKLLMIEKQKGKYAMTESGKANRNNG